MTFAFGALILIMSLSGYNMAWRMLGAEVHLSWLTAILTQIIALYAFAMLKLLNLGLLLVTYVGVLLFMVLLILLLWGKLRFPFAGTHMFDLWMIGMGIYMGWILYHSPLIHYDNYTQWALIVKFMNFAGRLPTVHDTLITYTSYPTGTGLFITYVVRLLGFSSGAMLLGQFILIWAGLYALFGVLRDKSRGLTALVLCFVLAMSNVFNIAIRMNNLLVDYVLPVLAAAGIAAVYIYRRKPHMQLLTVTLIGASLLLVKNSGTFFVLCIGAYYLYALGHYQAAASWRKRLEHVISLAVFAVGTYLPFAWWNYHVKTTFALSKHEISATAYKSQLAHETTAQIWGIGRKMVHALCSGSSLSANGILLLNLIVLAGWGLLRFWCRKQNALLKVLFAIDVGVILYVISLFGMYVLAMPYAEAKLLDGFERYMSSVMILALFIAAMAGVVAMDYAMYEQQIDKRSLRSFTSVFTKSAYQTSSLVLAIFSIIMMFSEANGVDYQNQMNINALPQQLDRIMRQRTTLNHDRVLIVDPHANDVANYFTGYVGRYYFFSDKVVGQENFDMSRAQFKQTVRGYKYVAIPEWHRTFSAMVKQVWGQHLKTGLFRVTRNGLVRMQKRKDW